MDSYWSYFSKGFEDEMKDFARQHQMETYKCVITGAETFKMVSPVFNQNLYSGVR